MRQYHRPVSYQHNETNQKFGIPMHKTSFKLKFIKNKKIEKISQITTYFQKAH